MRLTPEVTNYIRYSRCFLSSPPKTSVLKEDVDKYPCWALQRKPAFLSLKMVHVFSIHLSLYNFGFFFRGNMGSWKACLSFLLKDLELSASQNMTLPCPQSGSALRAGSTPDLIPFCTLSPTWWQVCTRVSSQLLSCAHVPAGASLL